MYTLRDRTRIVIVCRRVKIKYYIDRDGQKSSSNVSKRVYIKSHFKKEACSWKWDLCWCLSQGTSLVKRYADGNGLMFVMMSVRTAKNKVEYCMWVEWPERRWQKTSESGQCNSRQYRLIEKMGLLKIKRHVRQLNVLYVGINWHFPDPLLKKTQNSFKSLLWP